MNKKKINIIVTAGPTHEYIDPVRYITNPSTGVMGYEIARRAKLKGHNVTLISGPTNNPKPAGVKVVDVVTAWQMKNAVDKYFAACDCLVMAAAVADFRPQSVFSGKIKKKKSLSLILEQTPDILAGLVHKKAGRIIAGFALETENLIKNAKFKLKNKNLDFIVANLYSKNTIPFGSRNVSLYIIDKEDREEGFINLSKSRLAGIILDRIEKLWYKSINISRGVK